MVSIASMKEEIRSLLFYSIYKKGIVTDLLILALKIVLPLQLVVYSVITPRLLH